MTFNSTFKGSEVDAGLDKVVIDGFVYFRGSTIHIAASGDWRVKSDGDFVNIERYNGASWDTNFVLDGGVLELTEGVLLSELAASPTTPAAGKGTVWVKSTTPNVLIFTDDAGNDNQLLGAASFALTSVAVDASAGVINLTRAAPVVYVTGVGNDINMPGSPVQDDVISIRNLVTDPGTVKAAAIEGGTSYILGGNATVRVHYTTANGWRII